MIVDFEQCIPACFERQVRVCPETVCLESNDRTLTYSELNCSANRIAHAILEHPDSDGTAVALLFEHDTAAIVAILGVLKAGKAYVPLDPRFPPARTRAMLRESRAKLILTNGSGRQLARLWNELNQTVLDVEKLAEDLPVSDPLLNVQPESPACILFSSGSTGRPKGIVHSHRGVMHQLWDNTRTYGLDQDDRHGLVLSYCFAASVSEIFGPLLKGATLSLFNSKASDLNDLGLWLRRQRITVLKLPISLFRLFIGELRPKEKLAALRLVVLGGDTLYSKDLQHFWPHVSSSCRLVNRLASTETNTIAHIVLDQSVTHESEIVPLGPAAADKEVLILDESGASVGIDIEGEIAVRSDYLALSYWGREDLTAAAFRNTGDGRIYRTGDLGRVRANGYVEHLGRKDTQLKIRGYRVDLAEVKAALLGVAGVANAELTVREEEPGHKRLVAFIVPEQGRELHVHRVRQSISEILPDYMIPAEFTVLNEVPLTPTGKVDTLRLPESGNARLDLSSAWTAPEDEVEQVLVELWEELLDTSSVGTKDNFFELGGDSIRAIKLLTRVNDYYQQRLPVSVLLQAPTIKKMAAIMRKEVNIRSDNGLVPLQPHGRKPAFFCVPPAGTTVLPLSDLARQFAPDRPFYGLQPVGLSTDEAPQDRVEEIADNYIRRIRRVQPEGPYNLGGLCFGGIIAFEMARQLKRAGQSVVFLAILDTLKPPRLRIWKMPPRIMLKRIAELRNAGQLGSEVVRLFGVLFGKRGGGAFLLPEAHAPAVPGIRSGKKQVNEPAKVTWTPLDIARGRHLTDRFDKQVSFQINKLMQAHQEALFRYFPSPYDGQISLYRAPSLEIMNDRQSEWQFFSTRALEIVLVPGKHGQSESFFRGDNARSLAEHLLTRMDDN